MDHEKDGIRNFELATQSGNGRKSANLGLSRDAGRQFETFGSRVIFDTDEPISKVLKKTGRKGSVWKGGPVV